MGVRVSVGIDEQLRVLLRGCEHVYSPEELRARIATGKCLRAKLGVDPTSPDLTLGHTVVLRKLRQFQDLGHKAVLIIGATTAMIGDPTGRSKTRPMLTREDVDRNAKTYLDQAGRVLDLSPDKLEIRWNSEWLEKMTLADVVRLMSQMTVARMLERDTFAKRQAEGKEIYLHELLYPLMQARDSVEIEADVELGGTDQTFNNLCGRDLQRNAGQPPQIVMTMPLLVGIDGQQKMSKSLGNYIGVTDTPSEMFGKVMRVPDGLLGNYFELLTDMPKEEYSPIIDPATCNPRNGKERLARILIAQYHSAEAAEAAAAEFKRVHGGGGGGLPDEIENKPIPVDILQKGAVIPVDLIVRLGFADTRSTAKKLIAEGGVRLNGQAITDPFVPIPVKRGDVLQRGKRKFTRIDSHGFYGNPCDENGKPTVFYLPVFPSQILNLKASPQGGAILTLRHEKSGEKSWHVSQDENEIRRWIAECQRLDKE